jgi:hypothetical protein
MLHKRLRFSPEELRAIITHELACHPRAEPIDLYKLLNQSNYGPTHVIPVRKTVLASLRAELQNLPPDSGFEIQDIGCGRGFLRLGLKNLWLLEPRRRRMKVFADDREFKAGIASQITNAQLASCASLMLSSRFARPIAIRTWEKAWDEAVPLIRDLLDPPPSEFDSIKALLRSGMLPSHSTAYRELYAPHYRVVWLGFLPQPFRDPAWSYE